MKQIILLIALLVGMMFFVYWSNKNNNLYNALNGYNFALTQSPETILKVLVPDNELINTHEFKVEIANTAVSRSIGLSKYTNMEADRGMLFSFDKLDVKPEFWMKNMNFPIDIIWINDKKISEINSNILPAQAGTIDEKIVKYLPKFPVDYVLEIKAGEAARRGFVSGNEIVLPQIK